jgi:tetratricopeptide (TPR) repeat protein
MSENRPVPSADPSPSPDTAPWLELWDFNQPATSEQRFRAGLVGADGEEALLLRTQLARALGLQHHVDNCAAELDAVDEAIAAGHPGATERVRVLAALERGRMHRSAGGDGAAPLFQQALDRARAAGLDNLAADAAHMMAIIGSPQEQVRWAQLALDIATASPDPRARHWIGSVANNLGWTLHELGRHDEALAQWRCGLAAREEEGGAESIRVARWTVARGLRAVGRHAQAQAVQEFLASTGPEDGYVEEELGENLLATGQPTSAAPHFARAYELLATDESLAQHEPDRLRRLKELGGSG